MSRHQVLAGLGFLAVAGCAVPQPAPSPDSFDASAAPAEVPATGEISGVVRDADGRPAYFATVEVLRPARAGVEGCPGLLEGCSCGKALAPALAKLDQLFTPLGTAAADVEGRFKISGLPMGVALNVRSLYLRRYGAVRAFGGDHGLQLSLDQPVRNATRAMVSNTMFTGAAVLAVDHGQLVDFGRTAADYDPRWVRAPATARVFVFAESFAPGLLDRDSDFDLTDPDGGEPRTTIHTVNLEAGSVLTGTLVTTEGTPLPNVAVEARATGSEDSSCAVGQTGADGRFELGPVHSGSWRVFPRTAINAAPLEVSNGPPPRQRRDAGPENVEISARVVATDGGAFPGAKVSFMWSAPDGSDAKLKRGPVGPDGQLTHRGPAGNWQVSATARGFLDDQASKRLDGPARWEPVLTLQAAAKVSGRVEDAAGHPMSGIIVRATFKRVGVAEGEPITTNSTTGDDGTFVLETGEGEVELAASTADALPVTVRIQAPQQAVRLVFRPGAAVTGRVLDEEGRPAAKLPVRFGPLDGQEERSTESAADGTFRAQGLADGRYEVRAFEPAKGPEGTPSSYLVVASAQAAIEVRGSSAPPVELRLVRARAARGRVIDEAGRAVAGVKVSAFVLPAPGGPRKGVPLAEQLQREGLRKFLLFTNPVTTTLSATDGSFALEQLPPDRFYLTGDAPGLRDDPAATVLASAGSQHVTLRMIRSHFLTAQLKGADGKPLEAVTFNGVPELTPGGQLKLEIRARGTGPIWFGAEGHLPRTVQATMTPQADVALGALSLEAGRTLETQVVNALTGAPIRGAWWQLGEVMLASTDADHPRVTVPAGAPTLRVLAPGYVEAKVTVAEGQTSLEVRLDPGNLITGTVRDRAGHPPGRFTTSVRVEGCVQHVEAEVRPDGKFTVPGIPGGTCRINAEGLNLGPRGPVRLVRVPAHGNASVELLAP